MNAREFLRQLRDDAIVSAIAEAERQTSGEVRVFISRGQPADAVAAARQAFEKLGMTRTRERNGVLLFVAPKTQQFAVIGDAGIHERCGDEFWQSLVREMSERFGKAEFTEGITQVIRLAGERLARHFPRQPDDRNELPNQVVRE